MIKPHCPSCGHIFIGKACPCQHGRSPASLLCECGKKASEIYLDDQQEEWPLCARCLELEQDGFAPLPLPDYSHEEDPHLFNERIPFIEHFPLSKSTLSGGEFPPFGLTDREYEIAQLSHLHNAEVAYLLKISIATVKTHFNRIVKKLGIHSRHEIPYFLHRAPGLEFSDGDVKPETPASEAKPTPMATITLTITASASQLEGLLAWLEDCRDE